MRTVVSLLVTALAAASAHAAMGVIFFGETYSTRSMLESLAWGASMAVVFTLLFRRQPHHGVERSVPSGDAE